MTRLIALAVCLLLSGCYGSYASGRSAADFPREVRLIHLLGVENVSGEPRRPVEVDPSDPRATRGETEAVPGGMNWSNGMVDLFKRAMVERFRQKGIALVESPGSRPPDLLMHVTVYFAGGLFGYDPAIEANMSIRSPLGTEIRRERYVYSAKRMAPERAAHFAAEHFVDQAMVEIGKSSRPPAS